jgi:hypothetical protein
MWNRARSYPDLCECAARFVEGRSHSFPGWGAQELDAESVPLVPTLARLCRAGLLTTASQPGRRADASGYEQRAFVAGFLSATMLAELFEVAPTLRRAGPRAVALSRDARGARVIGRGDTHTHERALFSECIGSSALQELDGCLHVTIYDPIWGREDWLWQQLERGISARSAPSCRPQVPRRRVLAAPARPSHRRSRRPN